MVWRRGRAASSNAAVACLDEAIPAIVSVFNVYSGSRELAYCGNLFFSGSAFGADLCARPQPSITSDCCMGPLGLRARNTASTLRISRKDKRRWANPARRSIVCSPRLSLAMYRKQATLTAAVGIASDKVAAMHGIAEPHTVLNVFNWADRAQLHVLDPRAPLSLYWFSQIVGLDPGVADAIQALAYVGEPVVLHIRGAADGGSKIPPRHTGSTVRVDSRVSS